MPAARPAKNALTYFAFALASAVYLYPFIRSASEGVDAGIFLNGAAMVAQGAVPSRDFVEPTGPGCFLWLGLFFRIFGTKLSTAELLLSATAIAITLLVFRLSRSMGATGLFAALFVLVTLVPLLPHNSPHYDSLLFLLMGFSAFMLAWERLLSDEQSEPHLLLAISGGLLGLTSWFIQQEGLLITAALLAALLWTFRRRGVRFGILLAGSYASVVALLFVWFALLHALPHLLYANYIRPVTHYSNVNAAPYGYPIWQNLWPSFLSQNKSKSPGPMAFLEATVELVPFLALMWLPLLLPLAAFVGKVNVLQARTVPYWLAGYALWLSEIYRVDIGHLRYGSVLLALLFFTLCEMNPHGGLKFTGLVLIGCLAFCAAAHYQGAFHFQIPVKSRRGVTYAEVPLPLVGYLDGHTHPGEDVFIYPYQPIYYFLCNLHNPTRFWVLMYHYNPDPEFVEATRDLERKRVRVVVYDDLFSGQNLAQVFPSYHHPDASHLIMEPYLASHYHQVQMVGRFRILERNDLSPLGLNGQWASAP